MIMITNSFNTFPSDVLQIHRILQYLMITVLLVGSWYHHNTQLSTLVILIVMILYQSFVLLLNLKTDVFSNIKITLVIVFIDGVVTGVLIKFCGIHHGLSIGIVGLFILVHVKAITLISVAAILGAIIAFYIIGFTSIPTCNMTLTTEVVLFGLMTLFLLYFCISRGYRERSLKEKIEHQSYTNKTLLLHVHTLSKYLSPRLSKSIIANEMVEVKAMDKPITVFFSDIQGFSELTEKLSSEKLSWLVNTYLSEMSEIVFRFGGTLDKMIGDSIMVFFGDPYRRGKKNDALSCVCMAIAMKEAISNLQKRWKIAGIETPPSVRMGINTGNCRVGNFGTKNKLDYTVLGSTVNLASHLESIARANEILITEETYNLVKVHVQCTVNHSADSRWLSKDLKLYSADKMTSGIENSTSLSNFIDNP